jgi:hypothetical protein
MTDRKNCPKLRCQVTLDNFGLLVIRPGSENSWSEIVGKPVRLEQYDEDGRAELRFTTSDGHIHFIYVSPEYISRLSDK